MPHVAVGRTAALVSECSLVRHHILQQVECIISCTPYYNATEATRRSIICVQPSYSVAADTALRCRGKG